MKTEIPIGELSRRTGCKIETVRYYERIGLLPKARREGGGRFRRYDGDDVARLRFIRRARQLGFTLDEVRGLLQLDWQNFFTSSTVVPVRSTAQLSLQSRQSAKTSSNFLAVLCGLRTTSVVS